MIDQILKILVLLAGFLNAGMIAMQGFDLKRNPDSTGVSLKMFASFVVFQLIFALNGWRNGDVWQASGMAASMIATLWVISLVIRYRPKTPPPPT